MTLARHETFHPGDLVAFKAPICPETSLGVIGGLQHDDLHVLPVYPRKDPVQARWLTLEPDALSEGGLLHTAFVRADHVLILKEEQGLCKTGKLRAEKLDELLRQLAEHVVGMHYRAVHAEKKPFSPGQTPVPYAGRVYDDEEMTSLVHAALDFWLTAGRFSHRLEASIAEFLGVQHCVLTNSGSSANLLAVSALTARELGIRRLEPGDEVITVAAGFPTTVAPIIQNRLVPVFVDPELGTYNPSPDAVKRAVSEKTKAIFLPHTLGNPFEADEIRELADAHRLWLIEDNCDALGSKYKGRYTGTFGHLATLSFYPAHHMTMGEGGAVLSDDAELNKLVLSFRDWGRDCWCPPGCDNTCGRRFGWQLGDLPHGYDHKYIYSHIGYNLKATDMQAAVGVAQLRKLPGFIEARRRNWRTLREALSPLAEALILPEATDHSEPSWFGFLMTVQDNAPFTRNDVVQHLESHKIATRQLFGGNLIRQPAYIDQPYRVAGALTHTDAIMDRAFWIGVYPGLTVSMLEYVIKILREYVHGRHRR